MNRIKNYIRSQPKENIAAFCGAIVGAPVGGYVVVNSSLYSDHMEPMLKLSLSLLSSGFGALLGATSVVFWQGAIPVYFGTWITCKFIIDRKKKE